MNVLPPTMWAAPLDVQRWLEPLAKGDRSFDNVPIPVLLIDDPQAMWDHLMGQPGRWEKTASGVRRSS